MEVLDILDIIKRDWPLLVFVFAVGGVWWQGKEWFKKIDTALSRERVEHNDQSSVLSSIHEKLENLEERTDKIESTVNDIHDKVHEQEIKLAVLDSNYPTRRRTDRRS